jgi:hypothetical protein
MLIFILVLFEFGWTGITLAGQLEKWAGKSVCICIRERLLVMMYKPGSVISCEKVFSRNSYSNVAMLDAEDILFGGGEWGGV